MHVAVVQILVEDIDSNGDLELILQLIDGTVLCYSALSASLKWQRQLTRSSSTKTLDLRLVDIDNDLHLMVAMADDGLVYRTYVSHLARVLSVVYQKWPF